MPRHRPSNMADQEVGQKRGLVGRVREPEVATATSHQIWRTGRLASHRFRKPEGGLGRGRHSVRDSEVVTELRVQRYSYRVREPEVVTELGSQR